MRQWTDTLYCAYADMAEAQAQLAAAGVTPADRLVPTGSFCALVAPIVEWQAAPDAPEAGIARPGFWMMMKLDQNWDGYATAVAALQPYAQTLDDPANVFAGDGS
jgi:hypothetical protein